MRASSVWPRASCRCSPSGGRTGWWSTAGVSRVSSRAPTAACMAWPRRRWRAGADVRRLLVRRLLLLLPTLLGAATIVFVLLRAVPGDPVEIMLGESASPADAAALRRDLGLEGPPASQYVAFLGRVVRGD